MSPDETADFEIHLLDMLQVKSTEKYDVLNEVTKIKQLNPVCFFGTQESDIVRRRFETAGAKVITLVGDHHFNNNFSAIVSGVLKNIEKK